MELRGARALGGGTGIAVGGGGLTAKDRALLRHHDSGKELWGEHVDLTTPRGQAWYYESIRDFFSMISPKHWAMIDQKPIVMTYASSFARDYDQTHVTVAKERFAQDFGGMPFYLIKEVSWALESGRCLRVGWGDWFAFPLRGFSRARLRSLQRAGS